MPTSPFVPRIPNQVLGATVVSSPWKVVIPKATEGTAGDKDFVQKKTGNHGNAAGLAARGISNHGSLSSPNILSVRWELPKRSDWDRFQLGTVAVKDSGLHPSQPPLPPLNHDASELQPYPARASSAVRPSTNGQWDARPVLPRLLSHPPSCRPWLRQNDSSPQLRR